MTGEQKAGPSAQEIARKLIAYEEFKKKISEHSDSDFREAYRIICLLEQETKFLYNEFNTVMADYLLEVDRCNLISKELKKTLVLLKLAKGE